MVDPKNPKSVASSPKLADRLAREAREKLERNPSFLAESRDDFLTLLQMIRSAAKGKYKIPISTLLAAIGGVIYFLNPLDAIPDFIIGAGLIDDATVALLVLKKLKSDVESYRIWSGTQD